MKGIVFNLLQEFVEANAGYTLWDKAINETNLPSGGVYVATQNYGDSELNTLVSYLSEALNTPAPDLIRQYGEFLFGHLLPLAPKQAQEATNLREFLEMVENIIHVEVLKLYQDANLPTFEYPEQTETEMLMIYRSPRKLCYLSEGLILSAAKHFDTKVTVSQPQCMHNGADCCHIKIEFL